MFSFFTKYEKIRDYALPPNLIFTNKQPLKKRRKTSSLLYIAAQIAKNSKQVWSECNRFGIYSGYLYVNVLLIF